MKFHVISYSFSQCYKNESFTHFDAIEKAKELGFDAIDFTDFSGTFEEQLELAHKIKQKANEVGIELGVYTIGGELYKETEEERVAETERLLRQVDVAKELGVSLMRHDVCYRLGKSGPFRSFDLMLPYIAQSARTITEYAQSLGIRTCSENHGIVAQDSDRVERLFNAVAHDNYGILVDMANFTCVDEDHALAVSRVAPYAFHVHAKDMMIREQPTACCKFMTRGGKYFCGSVFGEGDVPVKRCLAILKRAGYNGGFTIEYEGVEECCSGIGRSLQNLKGFLNELEWK